MQNLSLKSAAKRPEFIALVIYIIVNGILLYFHKPWRDEAQVWLLARDMKFFELPGQMHYEGHPCLWHMIIYPFAHLGFPYFMQSAVAFSISTAAAVVLLFFSPFALYFRIIVLFSPLFTYYYPVIARNYCMIPLVLMLMGLFFEKRHESPWRYCILIGILVQTHSVMIMTAFAMGLCLFVEILFDVAAKKRDIKAFIPLFAPIASALFWLWQMMNNAKESALLRVSTASPRRTLEKIWETLLTASGDIAGFDHYAFLERISGELPGMLSAALVVVFLVFFVVFLFRIIFMKARGEGDTAAALTALFVVSLSFIFQFWFYTMVYSYSTQRLLSLPLLVLWGMFITERAAAVAEPTPAAPTVTASDATVESTSVATAVSKPARPAMSNSATIAAVPAFAVFCLILSLAALEGDIRASIQIPYSNAKQAADFIREEITDYQDAVFITDNEAEVTAIFPYLDRVSAIYAPSGLSFTYVTWDKHWNERAEYEVLKNAVENEKKRGSRIYIISCPERSYIYDNYLMDEDYERIFFSNDGAGNPATSIKGEDFVIYKG